MQSLFPSFSFSLSLQKTSFAFATVMVLIIIIILCIKVKVTIRSITYISSCVVIKPWKSLYKRESTYELVHKMKHIYTHIQTYIHIVHIKCSTIMQRASNLNLTLHIFTYITGNRWIFIVILFFFIISSKSMAKLLTHVSYIHA